MIASDIAYLKQQNFELKCMLQQIMRVVMPAAPLQNLSPAEIAINMARSGDVEGSKAFLKSVTTRRRSA